MEDKSLFFKVVFWYDPSKQTTTCSKLPTEALEQALKVLKVFV